VADTWFEWKTCAERGWDENKQVSVNHRLCCDTMAYADASSTSNVWTIERTPVLAERRVTRQRVL